MNYFFFYDLSDRCERFCKQDLLQVVCLLKL